MRAVVQRCSEAYVDIDGKRVGQIDAGLLILLGVEQGDTDKDLDYMVKKIVGLRVFDDADGKMNLCLEDVCGKALVVSQFTLLGDARKGRRPSYVEAAPPDIAENLYSRCCDELEKEGIIVARGVFMADMQVGLINDGPVTILLDSRRRF